MLGVETSCDETAVALVDQSGVLTDVVYSQEVHQQYGGVVPELAARAHVEKLVAVTKSALSNAGLERPDAVVATAGPGLVGALLVGLSFAKAMAATWEVPFVGVNHLEGHLFSILLEDRSPQFPFLALVVSGGHTGLYKVMAIGQVELLGQTVDDAAGEAYDKVARMLGLPYPGGPHIDRLAAEGNAEAVKFPRPNPGGMNFSFSGLKTAVRQHLIGADRATDVDVSASFQAAVLDCLTSRVEQAIKDTGIHRLTIGGGVAANTGLRLRLGELDCDLYLPPKNRCTDNAAMIANIGRLRLLAGQCDGLNLAVNPSWSLT